MSYYHDRGGEPGIPELAKRPARNCCTILTNRKCTAVNVITKNKIGSGESINSTVIISGSIQGREESQERRWTSVTHPSTAGERSGLLLPLDRYLLWLLRRGGRPGPQCSPAPSRPPIDPPRPAGTDPPIGPPPNPPRSLKLPRRPPGSLGSESGLSMSLVNGRSTNKRCHSLMK